MHSRTCTQCSVVLLTYIQHASRTHAESIDMPHQPSVLSAADVCAGCEKAQINKPDSSTLRVEKSFQLPAALQTQLKSPTEELAAQAWARVAPNLYDNVKYADQAADGEGYRKKVSGSTLFLLKLTQACD